jgi:hypothetical protein
MGSKNIPNECLMQNASASRIDSELILILVL